MTLPTASEITELYLFGDQGKPADLLQLRCHRNSWQGIIDRRLSASRDVWV